jgi:hypothetical protein
MSDDPTRPRFSAAEVRVLTLALDEIIPPRADGRLPGAGALGVAGDVEAVLQKTPELLRMVAEGLAALDARGFARLSHTERSDALSELPPVVILHAYSAYYQHPRIAEALGLEPRPPHPKGYEMAPNDLSLLDLVRRRGRLWRSVE